MSQIKADRKSYVLRPHIVELANTVLSALVWLATVYLLFVINGSMVTVLSACCGWYSCSFAMLLFFSSFLIISVRAHAFRSFVHVSTKKRNSTQSAAAARAAVI